MLVYFFTTVGMSSRISDLVKGGPILALMLLLTAGFMVVQVGIGFLGAVFFGLPSHAGVMLGTAALIGGHGTAIVWGPVVESTYGISGAVELGIATATLGLIVASSLGGPIARYLIFKHKPEIPKKPRPNLEEHPRRGGRVSNGDLLRSILWLNISVAIGVAVHAGLQDTGVKLTLFVPCLIAGIVISNVVPRMFRRIEWPSGHPGHGADRGI
ncbi:MAG TPA: sodium/glutamate symporter [Roseovarius sp.]